MKAVVATVLLFGVLAGAAAGQSPCPDGYVCGLDDPEDLIRVPGTPYVITTGLGDPDNQHGGLYSVHVRTRVARELALDLSGPPAARFSTCPGPPDRELFSAHGLALSGTVARRDRTTATLYLVNHGGRESIEVFRVVASAKRVTVRWTGCVPTPDGLAANSVAPLPGGELVATVPLLSEGELLDAGLGRPTGEVARWSSATGWRPVPGAEVSFPNGVLVSPDARRLYVAGYTEQTVVEVPLAAGSAVRRVAVSFNPDNLRWAPSGEILAGGQDEEPAVVQFTCVESDQETCPIPTGVARVDPATFRAVSLFRHPGDEDFGMGTSAVVVGRELWIGSARAHRLLRVPPGGLAAPVAPDTASGLPSLRLSRRCLGGGRMRVAVTGDVGDVERVRFGRALDRRPPFARALPRSTRLRAAVTVLRGERTRMLLARRLRGCGAPRVRG